MAVPRSRSKARKRQTPRSPKASGAKTVPTRRVPRDLAMETDEEPMGGVRQEPRTRRPAPVEPS